MIRFTKGNKLKYHINAGGYAGILIPLAMNDR